LIPGVLSSHADLRELLWHAGCFPPIVARLIPGLETPSLNRREEVAAMGGPWRERGFDAALLRSPRPYSGPRAGALASEREPDRLGKVVVVYIMAVALSFGLMLSLLQQGW
jgi:hypothetical protein